MDEQVMQKVLANVIHDAKTSLLSNHSIPVMWNMVTEDLIYQVSKTIVEDEDAKFALELVSIAKSWVNPLAIIQVANTTMNMFTADSTTPREIEALIVVKHVPNRNPATHICEVIRNDDGNVIRFSNFYGARDIEYNNELFSPYSTVIDNPSREAIQTVQTMFGSIEKPLLRVVS